MPSSVAPQPAQSEALARLTRRDVRREDRRREILHAAARICAAQGPDALTIRAVAGEAGYVAGAVYSYFSGIDELVLALAAEELGQIARDMKDAGTSAATPADRLRARVRATRQTMVARPAQARLAGRLLATPREAIPEDLDRLVNGRLIAALQSLNAPLRDQTRLVPDEAHGETMILAALMIGLGLLEQTGRLDVLGFSADALLDRHLARFDDP